MNEVGIKYKRSSSNDLVPVVDLFAGPGGLSEGFSSLTVNNEAFFRIGYPMPPSLANRATNLAMAPKQAGFAFGKMPSIWQNFAPGHLFGIFKSDIM